MNLLGLGKHQLIIQMMVNAMFGMTIQELGKKNLNNV
jgi:hypothetical protein